jgi:hypothetical protein
LNLCYEHPENILSRFFINALWKHSAEAKHRYATMGFTILGTNALSSLEAAAASPYPTVRTDASNAIDLITIGTTGGNVIIHYKP